MSDFQMTSIILTSYQTDSERGGGVGTMPRYWGGGLFFNRGGGVPVVLSF